MSVAGLLALSVACGRTALDDDDWRDTSTPDAAAFTIADASIRADATSTLDANITPDAGAGVDLPHDSRAPDGFDAAADRRDTSDGVWDEGGVFDAGCTITEFMGDAASFDWPTACLGSGNTFIWSGGYATYGSQTVVARNQSGWTVIASNVPGIAPPTAVLLEEIETRPPLCQNWYTVDLVAPTAQSLAPGTYTDVRSAEGFLGDHPGLTVRRNGIQCTTETGQFTILDIDTKPSANDAGVVLTRLTATFQHFCDGDSTPSMGCIHFAQ